MPDAKVDAAAFLSQLDGILKSSANADAAARWERVQSFIQELRAFVAEREKGGLPVADALFAMTEVTVLMAFAIKYGNRAKARDMLSDLIDGIFNAFDEGVQSSPELSDLLKKANAASERGDQRALDLLIQRAKEQREAREKGRASE